MENESRNRAFRRARGNAAELARKVNLLVVVGKTYQRKTTTKGTKPNAFTEKPPSPLIDLSILFCSTMKLLATEMQANFLRVAFNPHIPRPLVALSGETSTSTMEGVHRKLRMLCDRLSAAETAARTILRTLNDRANFLHNSKDEQSVYLDLSDLFEEINQAELCFRAILKNEELSAVLSITSFTHISTAPSAERERAQYVDHHRNDNQLRRAIDRGSSTTAASAEFIASNHGRLQQSTNNSTRRTESSAKQERFVHGCRSADTRGLLPAVFACQALLSFVRNAVDIVLPRLSARVRSLFRQRVSKSTGELMKAHFTQNPHEFFGRNGRRRAIASRDSKSSSSSSSSSPAQNPCSSQLPHILRLRLGIGLWPLAGSRRSTQMSDRLMFEMIRDLRLLPLCNLITHRCITHTCTSYANSTPAPANCGKNAVAMIGCTGTTAAGTAAGPGTRGVEGRGGIGEEVKSGRRWSEGSVGRMGRSISGNVESSSISGVGASADMRRRRNSASSGHEGVREGPREGPQREGWAAKESEERAERVHRERRGQGRSNFPHVGLLGTGSSSRKRGGTIESPRSPHHRSQKVGEMTSQQDTSMPFLSAPLRPMPTALQIASIESGLYLLELGINVSIASFLDSILLSGLPFDESGVYKLYRVVLHFQEFVLYVKRIITQKTTVSASRTHMSGSSSTSAGSSDSMATDLYTYLPGRFVCHDRPVGDPTFATPERRHAPPLREVRLIRDVRDWKRCEEVLRVLNEAVFAGSGVVGSAQQSSLTRADADADAGSDARVAIGSTSREDCLQTESVPQTPARGADDSPRVTDTHEGAVSCHIGHENHTIMSTTAVESATGLALCCGDVLLLFPFSRSPSRANIPGTALGVGRSNKKRKNSRQKTLPFNENIAASALSAATPANTPAPACRAHTAPSLGLDDRFPSNCEEPRGDLGGQGRDRDRDRQGLPWVTVGATNEGGSLMRESPQHPLAPSAAPAAAEESTLSMDAAAARLGGPAAPEEEGTGAGRDACTPTAVSFSLDRSNTMSAAQQQQEGSTSCSAGANKDQQDRGQEEQDQDMYQEGVAGEDPEGCQLVVDRTANRNVQAKTSEAGTVPSSMSLIDRASSCSAAQLPKNTSPRAAWGAGKGIEAITPATSDASRVGVVGGPNDRNIGSRTNKSTPSLTTTAAAAAAADTKTTNKAVAAAAVLSEGERRQWRSLVTQEFRAEPSSPSGLAVDTRASSSVSDGAGAGTGASAGASAGGRAGGRAGADGAGGGGAAGGLASKVRFALGRKRLRGTVFVTLSIDTQNM